MTRDELFLSNSLQFIVKKAIGKSRGRFAKMNVNSPLPIESLDHFDRVNINFRVLFFGDAVRASGHGWDFVKGDIGSTGEIGHVNAECCWVDAGNPAAVSIAALRGAGLPLVVAVAENTSPAVDAAVAALIDAADGYVLPDDSDAVVAAVLAGAAASGSAASALRVAELSDGAARTMQALSIEASRIAAQLSALAAQEATNVPPVRGVDARLVRRIIKLRRDRERFFPMEIFADPAWDMLLDLVAARLEDKRVPVSSLCIAASVPTTTALRWIRSLTEAGLLLRRVDTLDARRSHIELSDTAATAMLGYLQLFSDQFDLR